MDIQTLKKVQRQILKQHKKAFQIQKLSQKVTIFKQVKQLT